MDFLCSPAAGGEDAAAHGQSKQAHETGRSALSLMHLTSIESPTPPWQTHLAREEACHVLRPEEFPPSSTYLRQPLFLRHLQPYTATRPTS